MSSVRRWKRGSTSPSIQDTLLDADGVAIDLTGADVLLVMGPVGGTATLQGSATIVGTATAGVVRYDWGTTDLATVGLYNAFWQITYSGGAIEKLPQGGTIPGEPDFLLVRVTDDLS